MALILTLPFSFISQALWLWALILFFDIVFFEVFGRIPDFWSSMEAYLHFSYLCGQLGSLLAPVEDKKLSYLLILRFYFLGTPWLFQTLRVTDRTFLLKLSTLLHPLSSEFFSTKLLLLKNSEVILWPKDREPWGWVGGCVVCACLHVAAEV